MHRPPLRVLLVEDSDDDALLVIETLRDRYEPEVTRVESREEMSRVLASGFWDVIISDHNLPRFSATEALSLVLATRRDIPFIIVSGTIGEELAVEAMKAGAHDFVMKDALGKLVPAVEHAVEAGEMRRLHRKARFDLEESRERLRQLAVHLDSVREEERRSLSREIHDELGGVLTALKMEISWLKGRCNAEGTIAAKLASLSELTDSAIRSMRRIITDLRPAVIDDLGLVAAVEWQLTEFQRRTGIATELAIEPALNEMAFSPALAITAFRIFQESLTNVARHAGASRVEAAIGRDERGFFLSVRDNGRGLAQEQLKKQDSYGILGMHERTLALGGELHIEAVPEGGTMVTLMLPLHEMGHLQ